MTRKSTNFRYKGFWFDFCGDVRFSKERIKGKDKKFLGKWSRKKQSNWLEESFEDKKDE